MGTSQSWGGKIPTGTSGFGVKVWDESLGFRLSEGLKGSQEAPGNVPKAGKSQQRKGNPQGEEPKSSCLGHSTHRSKPLCNSSPGIWEEEGKAFSSSSSGGFGSLWELQAVPEPSRHCLHQEFPRFFPSSHLPQSLRSPWSPCPRSPEMGAPIASAVSTEPRSPFLTPPMGSARH